MYVPFYVYTFLCLCIHLLCIHLSMYAPFYVNGDHYVQCCPWRHHVRGVSPLKSLSVALHRLVICWDRIKGVVRAIICHWASGEVKHLHVGLPSTILLFGYRGLYSSSVVLFWSSDLGRAAAELVDARRLDGFIDTRTPFQLLGRVNGVAVLVPNKRTNRHEDIPQQQHKKIDTKR